MPRTRAAAAAATAAAVPKGDSKANGHANGHTQQAIRYRTIGHRGRAALLRYKYSAVDRSIIAPYLQPLWTRVVDLIPAWVAPNCVTTSGLALVVLSSALAYLHSPHLDAPLPTWVLLAHAALVFTYQTLDAVDGKQARRTGSSGPLGELCDHTCDALVCTFETFAVGSTVLAGLGGSHTVLALWLVGTWPFCMATWRMYHTGVMTLPEFNGPNEGLALLYLTQTVTACVGQAALWGAGPWHVRLPGDVQLSVRPAHVYAASGIAMALVDTLGHLYAGLSAAKAQGRTRRRAMAQLSPYMGLVACLLAWSAWSPTDVAGTQPYVLLLGFGMQFAYLMARLILAHLCDEHTRLIRAMWRVLVPLPLAVGNAAYARFVAADGQPLVDENALLWFNCVYATFMYVRFAMNVTHDITAWLGIYCFSLHRRTPGWKLEQENGTANGVNDHTDKSKRF